SRNPLTLTGGTLRVTGTVEVDNTFKLDGGTLAGATVVPGSGGQVFTVTARGGTLDGGILATDVNLSNSADLNGVNGLTLDHATATLQSTGTFTTLNFSGSQHLKGTGTVAFGGTSDANTVRPTGGTGTTLTVDSGVTVRTGTRGGTLGWY